jgi:hypothetical protein
LPEQAVYAPRQAPGGRDSLARRLARRLAAAVFPDVPIPPEAWAALEALVRVGTPPGPEAVLTRMGRLPRPQREALSWLRQAQRDAARVAFRAPARPGVEPERVNASQQRQQSEMDRLIELAREARGIT